MALQTVLAFSSAEAAPGTARVNFKSKSSLADNTLPVWHVEPVASKTWRAYASSSLA